MGKPAMVMSETGMLAATQRANAKVQTSSALERKVVDDLSRESRLFKGECGACFYGFRMGGAAMTERPCMSCASMQLYGSTSTDVLCMPCATSGGLCKHCGGDLDMQVTRKVWPSAYSQPAAEDGSAGGGHE